MTTNLLANHRWPFPVLTKLHAPGQEPERARVLQALKEIRSNAASITQQTYAPAGVGLIGLVCTNAEHLAETNEGFQMPELPDEPLDLQDEYGNIEEQRRYKEQMETYRLVNAVDSTLAQMLLSSADEIWWEELEKPLTGYGNIRAIDFVTHMLNNYAKMDEETRSKTKQDMETPWTTGPLETVVGRIQKGAATLSQGGIQSNDQSKCDTLYAIVHGNGRLNSACQKWRMLPAAQKTWDACKKHFLQYSRDLKHDDIAGLAGYMNFCMEIKAAKDEMKSAVNEIKQQQANMATNSNRLEQENARLKSELAATKAQLKLLTDLMQIKPSNNNNNNNSNAPRQNFRDLPCYCWTHGYNKEHGSKTCPDPKPGHQELATKENPLGGMGHRARRGKKE